MIPIDMSKLFYEHANKWVALTDDKQVIASGDSLSEVLKISSKKGYPDPITALLPDPKTEYVL